MPNPYHDSRGRFASKGAGGGGGRGRRTVTGGGGRTRRFGTNNSGSTRGTTSLRTKNLTRKSPAFNDAVVTRKGEYKTMATGSRRMATGRNTKGRSLSGTSRPVSGRGATGRRLNTQSKQLTNRALNVNRQGPKRMRAAGSTTKGMIRAKNVFVGGVQNGRMRTNGYPGMKSANIRSSSGSRSGNKLVAANRRRASAGTIWSKGVRSSGTGRPRGSLRVPSSVKASKPSTYWKARVGGSPLKQAALIGGSKKYGPPLRYSGKSGASYNTSSRRRKR